MPELTSAFLGPIGWPEMIILACLGLLIFGKRLPEVGKSLGKGIVQFKKGLQGVEDEIEQAANRPEDEEIEPRKIEEKSAASVGAGSAESAASKASDESTA